MKYRNFTKDNLSVSQLGFGCMRFPTLDDKETINKEESTNMLDYAIDNGVNYIDTAFPYHNEQSELFVGEYFQKNGRRKDIYLATKCPVWKAEKEGDFYNLLKLQLERLQVEYVDFYLLHALDRQRWDKITSLNVFEDMKRAKEEGLIRYLGFSFHDEYPLFEEICDAYDWDFTQIQLNYMDIGHQAGLQGLDYAHNKGFSVVIMEPIKGGKLAYPPQDIQDLFKEASNDFSPSGHALAYLFNREEVSVVLSGMSSMAQVEDNVNVASIVEANSLDEKDQDIYIEAKMIFDKRTQVGCTSCDYCMPCPQEVEIPKIFKQYNNLHVYGEESNKDLYEKLQEENHDASHCVECGSCESQCPQHLNIIEDLKSAHDNLTEV